MDAQSPQEIIQAFNNIKMLSQLCRISKLLIDRHIRTVKLDGIRAIRHKAKLEIRDCLNPSLSYSVLGDSY